MPRPPRQLHPDKSARDWFGAELRHWRVLRNLTQGALGAKVHVSGDLIRRIETAERGCTEGLPEALDTALNAGGVLTRANELVVAETDRQRRESDKSSARTVVARQQMSGGVTLETYQVPEPNGGVTPAVDRRRFLTTSGTTLATGSILALTTPTAADDLPRTVRAEHIEQITAAADTLTGWEYHYGGGGLVREAAFAQLRWCAELLEAQCPVRLRPNLFAAAAQLGMAVGACAFDSKALTDASRFFTFAATCAEEGDAWHVRAKVYSWRARQAIWCGDPDNGLTLAEIGLARSDRLTATELAMLHTARARAFARLGRPKETLAAVGTADSHFVGSNAAEDPTWMRYYDHAQHQGDTGHALYDIAIRGHAVPQAVERLSTAVREHGDQYARSRAFSRTKLAALQMLTGDPEEAACTGHTAVREIDSLNSRRAYDNLSDLTTAAGRRKHSHEARDLHERLITMSTP